MFRLVTGTLTLVGMFVVVITDFVGRAVVDDVGMVADTISALAAGPYAWIMDTGLVICGLSTAILALGLYRWKLDGKRWTAGAILLVLIALAIITLALVDEYGDRDETGAIVHYKLVYLIGFLFSFVPVLMAKGFRSVQPFFANASFFIAALWFVGGPYLFFIPTQWDGLYERGLTALMMVWIIWAAILMIRASRHAK